MLEARRRRDARQRVEMLGLDQQRPRARVAQRVRKSCAADRRIEWYRDRAKPGAARNQLDQLARATGDRCRAIAGADAGVRQRGGPARGGFAQLAIAQCLTGGGPQQGLALERRRLVLEHGRERPLTRW